jgi:membrane fusion protein
MHSPLSDKPIDLPGQTGGQIERAQPHESRELGGAGELLFRREAVMERQTQWMGTVLLAPSPSHRLFVVVGVLAAAAIVALLFLGEFTRKARVNGWLVPEQGMIRIYAPRPGLVTNLHVYEGLQVRRGGSLVTLSDELQSSAMGATQAEITRRLTERIRSLRDEGEQQQQLFLQQERTLHTRLQMLTAELMQCERDIALLGSRVAIAERAEALHRDMRDKGYISDARLQQVEGEKLEHRVRLGALERNYGSMMRARLQVEAELRDLPLKRQKEIAALGRNVSELEQARAEAEARREIVVTAPQDGTVTAIYGIAGAYANATVPLLSIVPSNAKLEAHLYGPSRAIGFVQPGQRVLVRYSAFAYQRFGHYEGVVSHISRMAVAPGELPPQISTVSSLTAANPGGATEPIYRITVALRSQHAIAYGQPVALQPGMLLEADVALEKRRLYEWVLDPLFSLTGKWQ